MLMPFFIAAAPPAKSAPPSPILRTVTAELARRQRLPDGTYTVTILTHEGKVPLGRVFVKDNALATEMGSPEEPEILAKHETGVSQWVNVPRKRAFQVLYDEPQDPKKMLREFRQISVEMARDFLSGADPQTVRSEIRQGWRVVTLRNKKTGEDRRLSYDLRYPFPFRVESHKNGTLVGAIEFKSLNRLPTEAEMNRINGFFHRSRLVNSVEAVYAEDK